MTAPRSDGPAAPATARVDTGAGFGMDPARAESGDALAVPILEEHLDIGTRQVDTHTVRLRKHVEADEVEVAVPLEREQIEIERVAVNRVVDATEPPRRDGDVTVVPVYEEVLVKRWLLREELRIRHVRSTGPVETVRAVLRRETVDVVRTPLAPASPPTTPSDLEPRP